MGSMAMSSIAGDRHWVKASGGHVQTEHDGEGRMIRSTEIEENQFNGFGHR